MRFIIILFLCATTQAAPYEYLEFIRAQASRLRSADEPPASLADWTAQKAALRENLARAWGGIPTLSPELNVRKLGELRRDGCLIEKLIIETFPGVWMTANSYVPARAGKLPALLMVHGHWRGAKQDPVVQARCIGAARLGFFVLVVDAFGAGERGVGEALGEYHGGMTAATLLPAGLALSGLQVAENTRAIDYLRSRKEVDPDRIGITGASGGGNQTMYAAAWDERIQAAVPVCSVGNYQAYLGAACCMCEVVPGALRFTEEWGVLGMIAPRALMVINATRDARQFSVEEARISLKFAAPIYELFGKKDHLRHTTFESGHDYSKPMREAVYGWMAWHLKNEGSGEPISEPPITTEEPETLRCFPGDSRPDDWITLPKFAAREARRLLAAGGQTRSAKELVKLLGSFPELSDLNVQAEGTNVSFSPEPGIRLTAKYEQKSKDKLLIILNLEGAEKIDAHWKTSDWSVVTLDLRATGKHAYSSDRIGGAPDHTTAQWGLWIGRPLLGQWAWDVRRLIDALQERHGSAPKHLAILGIGPAGFVALTSAILDDRISRVATDRTLRSFITETPYAGQRLGTLVPGMIAKIGDVPDLERMVAPRPLFRIESSASAAREFLTVN